ncbi:hypothetical protein GCM10010975_31530 [Comamonas phosphati]|nr:hypothetical protein GCM10010975_31530 [Comamonas phosphati]
MNNYEGPRDGDYVAYVERLLRASPEFRRTSSSIASAMGQASATPGSQPESSLTQMRAKLQQARAEQFQRTGNAAGAARPVRTPAAERVPGQAEAQRRFQQAGRDIDSRKEPAAPKRRPWVSPLVLLMIVAGAMLAQVSPAIGTVVSLMGWLSLIGNVIARLKGK